MKLVLHHIPEATVDERREALKRASNHALKRGVTTVVDFGRYFPGASPEQSWEDFSGFSSYKKNQFTLLFRNTMVWLFLLERSMPLYTYNTEL